jgi:hypothetical protein
MQFVLGILFSIGLAMIAVGQFVVGPLGECQKEHNIYKCEWVTQPVLRDE